MLTSLNKYFTDLTTLSSSLFLSMQVWLSEQQQGDGNDLSQRLTNILQKIEFSYLNEEIDDSNDSGEFVRTGLPRCQIFVFLILPEPFLGNEEEPEEVNDDGEAQSSEYWDQLGLKWLKMVSRETMKFGGKCGNVGF
jgi:hypothetical protein